MVKNYLKIFIRILFKNPLYSIINIISFALSISISIIIITILANQLNNDSYKSDKNKIFRIITDVKSNNTEGGEFATTPLPLATELDKLAFIKDVSVVRPIRQGIKIGHNNIAASCAFVDSKFLKIFPFELTNSSVPKLLNEPNTIIVSQEFSEKMFGDASPIGEVITLNGMGDYKIEGVLKKSKITHISYDVLISQSSSFTLEKQHKIDSVANKWGGYQNAYTYVKVDRDNGQSILSDVLKSISSSKRSMIEKNTGVELLFKPQPITSINPTSGLFLENSRGISMTLFYIFLVVIILLMGLTCFNYSNLTAARSIVRMKEMGVRKVLGASKKNIFLQFIVESILMALVSLIFSYIIAPLIPINETLQRLINYRDLISPSSIFFVTLYCVSVGFFAGLVPALIMSKLRAVHILNNAFNLKFLKLPFLSRSLIFIQFSLSFVISIIILTSYKQMSYISHAQYGFTDENIINVVIPENQSFNVARNEVSKINEVQVVGGVSDIFGYYPTEEFVVANGAANNVSMACYYTDQNVLNAYGLKLIAGENFPLGSKDSTDVIINETALQPLLINSPSEALGKYLKMNDTTSLRIIGVIKDFHFQNMKHPISPLLLKLDESKVKYLSLSIPETRHEAVINKIEQAWKQLGVHYKPNIFTYRDFREQQLHSNDLWAIGYFALLIVLITCISLLGIASISAKQRTKEITIRMVLGASKSSAFLLLAKEYILLIFLAALVGIPVGYIISNKILNGFSYKVTLGWEYITSCFLFIALLGIIISATQILKLILVGITKNLRTQ